MGKYTSNDALDLYIEIVESCGCLGDFQYLSAPGDGQQRFVFQRGTLLAGPPDVVGQKERLARRIFKCAFGEPHDGQ